MPLLFALILDISEPRFGGLTYESVTGPVTSFSRCFRLTLPGPVMYKKVAREGRGCVPLSLSEIPGYLPKGKYGNGY